MARRLISIAAALAAVLVFGAVTRGTWAQFTANRTTISANTVTVDSLAAHFQVTPGSAVQPGTSTKIASGDADSLSLSFGTVPSAQTFTNVFTVKNIGAAPATASLSLAGVSQISSVVFASSGTGSATLAAGASTTVSVSTSATTAGHGAGTLRLGMSGYSWLYRDYASTINEAPEAPGPLSATAKPAGKISLAWTASSTTANLAGYNVYRSTGGSYTKLNASPLSSTTYDDTATANGTTYTYKISAVSSGSPILESVYSPTASAAADSSAPAQPSSVALANGGGTGNAYINSANKSSVSVSVTLGAGSLAADTVTITLTSGAGSVSKTGPASAGAGTVTLTGIDASALADGSLTISATSTDLVGNVSTARTTTVTKDTVVSAPTATYVDNSNPAADQITGTTEANATITANQTQPSASGPYTATAAANGSYTVALAKIKNQNVTYTVTATDAAGNTSAQTSVSFNDTK
jgi:hypothetical protein